MTNSVILSSIVERLKRYSAKYFYLEKYTITNVNWDKANKQAVITLDRELNKLFNVEQSIVVDDIPYKWIVNDLSFDFTTNNILLTTAAKTILHGSLFAYNLLHLSGVQVKKPVYDINGNLTSYVLFTEATEFINRTYEISQINDRTNHIIALDYANQKDVKDKYVNLLYYKCFDGIDNLQFDFTTAQILFYPKEHTDLMRINNIYENTKYSVDVNDRKIIYLQLDEFYCQDEFFDTAIAQESFLYTSPQIAIGDFNSFLSWGKNMVALAGKLNTVGALNEVMPKCYATIEYDGFVQRTPIQSIDDTTATGSIVNVKQNYMLRLSIVNINAEVDTSKRNQYIAQSNIIEHLKINIHNNMMQVLQDFPVETGFDDLTYANKARAYVNFDADSANWEWLDAENTPMYVTTMIIQTVYDEKKISRLERMLVKEPTATGVNLASYANAVESPKKISI